MTKNSPPLKSLWISSLPKAALLVFGIFLIWIFLKPTEKPEPVSQQSDSEAKPSPIVTPPKKAVQPVLEDRHQDKEVLGEKEASSTPAPANMQQALQNIADDYEQQIRFPPYSKPLKANQHDLLNPHESIPVKRAIDDEALFSFEMTAQRYLIFHGETIRAKLVLYANTSEPLPFVDDVTLQVRAQQQVLTEIPFEEAEQTATQRTYVATVAPSEEERETWPEELYLKASVRIFSIGTKHAGTPIRYLRSVASFVDSKAPQVVGPHLEIPLVFALTKPGRYKVTANLVSQGSKTPIAHLQTREFHETSQATFTLKAHISTLRHQEANGPYLLTQLQIQRIPDQLGEPYQHGRVPSEMIIRIPHFPWSTYQQESYQNPHAQQKLQLLKKLAAPK